MKRTHRVQVYRPPASDANPYDATGSAWEASGNPVDANLQPLTGSVQQTAAGREVGATWRGFLPAGTAVAEGDGIQVLSGAGPSRFRVQQVGEQGAPWDTEVLLDRTEEAFTA